MVHNARYLAYADVACTEWRREMVSPYEHVIAAGLDSVLAEATVRYLAPLRADELDDIALRW